MGKYEEALERARQGKPIDEVFPEIREFECEQVIRIIKKRMCCDPIPISAEDRRTVENWLEKQKEQKPSTPKFRVGDVMRTKREATEGITDGLPVIVSVDDNNYNCTNELISISDQEEYEFPPMNRRQKSAGWSDEDVKMIGIAISFIQAASCNSILGVDKLDVIAWLKALRSGILNGNGHRKPSEEQINALKEIDVNS